MGQTTDTLEERMKGHRKKRSNCFYLKRAIDKYGWDSMKVEVLVELAENDQPLLDLYEREMIKDHGTKAPAGYNLDDGGRSGGVRNEETKQKIRDTFERKSKEQGYKGRIHVRSPTSFRVIWRHNKHIGTYRTREAAEAARLHYFNTGEKLPGVTYTTVGVSCRDPNTDEVLAFSSVKEAAAHIGCSAVFVTMVCNNTYKRKTRAAKGWKCWKTEDGEYD